MAAPAAAADASSLNSAIASRKGSPGRILMVSFSFARWSCCRETPTTVAPASRYLRTTPDPTTPVAPTTTTVFRSNDIVSSWRVAGREPTAHDGRRLDLSVRAPPGHGRRGGREGPGRAFQRMYPQEPWSRGGRAAGRVLRLLLG